MSNDELRISQSGQKLIVLLPTDDTATLEADGLKTTGTIKLKLEHTGQGAQILEIWQNDLP